MNDTPATPAPSAADSAPTPRTDAAIQFRNFGSGHIDWVSVKFARTLERELNEARDSIVLQTDAITQLRAELAAKDSEIAELADQLRIVVDAESFRARKIERERDSYRARAEKAEAERDALKMSEEESGEVISDLRAERDQLRAEVERLRSNLDALLADTSHANCAQLAAAKEDSELLNDADRYLGDAQLKDGSFPFPDHPQPVRVALRAAIDTARKAHPLPRRPNLRRLNRDYPSPTN